jgi:plastocyanin
MRAFVTAAALIGVAIGLWGCSGNGYSSGSPNPSSPTAPSGDSSVITINVVAINGAQSFTPNPATVPTGQTVVWRNVDSVTHHVVLNDRSVDTGDLAPGTSSQPMTIAGTSNGQYHCSIHPEMVGSINQATAVAPPPPCVGQYCD